MKMDVLAILMVAFCLFAILMFILFYIYARKYFNEKKITDDYTKLDDGIVDDTPQIELIDISINDKNYVFDANNYQLNYNDKISININGTIYDGVVTKSNYRDDLGHYEQLPTKLVLENKKVEESIVSKEMPKEENSESEEFIPKKKDEII